MRFRPAIPWAGMRDIVPLKALANQLRGGVPSGGASSDGDGEVETGGTSTALGG